MGVAVGHSYRFGVKKQTNAWGGLPLVLGAGDGFEVNNESFKANVGLIMNEGIIGVPYRRPGSPGHVLPGGDLEFDLYYRCASHRLIATAFGLDTVTVDTPGTGANQHDLTLVNSHTGKHVTLAELGAEGTREWPTVKVTGTKMMWDESKMRGYCSMSGVGFDENLNVGSPNTSLVVSTAAASNGVKTIAAQPPVPSPVTFTLTGVTELVTTIVYTNIRGDQVTEVHTRSTGGLTYTTLQYVKTVISITCASIAGAGNFSAGVSNGVNNDSTVSAITTVTERDCTNFSQLRFYINEQGGADFLAADEQFLSSLEVGLTLNMDSRVTTEFGYRTSEPSTGGAGWPEVTFAMNFSALTDRNRRHLTDRLGKGQLKAKAILTGPQIAATGFAHTMTIYLNGLQLEGDVSVGGPGVLPFDIQGQAHSVLAVPTGFPAGTDEACLLRLVNGLSTAII